MSDSQVKATQKPPSSAVRWAIVVFSIAFIERLLILFFYQPVTYSDTPSYRRLADTVLQGFKNYDGTRTPGYPVFLALAGSDQHVWWAQLFLGLITTMLLFWIGWKLTDKPAFGGLIALAHTLNLGQLFFESDLLTESLTTFLIVLTTAEVFLWLSSDRKHTIWLAFLIGLTSSITLLVRPLFIYLPIYILIFFAVTRQLKFQPSRPSGSPEVMDHPQRLSTHRMHWLLGVALLLPVIVLVGRWMNFIHSNFREWSLTTMTGYHLIQHTGSFFEYVPDEYAALRDVYIRYRDAHIAQYGTQTNTIWEAIPEMSRVSGYSFYELSRVLTRISIQLILDHPVLFIRNAITGWWMFWRTAFYWSADALRFPLLASGMRIAILIERGVLFLINMLFIFASLYYGLSESISAIRHKATRTTGMINNPASLLFFWFLMGMIWIASILQTLLDHGDNPRFLVPLQSLVVLWVGMFFYFMVQNVRTRNTNFD